MHFPKIETANSAGTTEIASHPSKVMLRIIKNHMGDMACAIIQHREESCPRHQSLIVGIVQHFLGEHHRRNPTGSSSVPASVQPA